MKKHFFENKRIKLIARVVLLVLLLASALTLTACPGNSQRELYFVFSSYDEMFEYATMHKQTFPSDDCIFWMFDLDEYENITLIDYFVEILWYAEGLDYYIPIKEDKIPSDHINIDNTCEYTMSIVSDNGNIIENAYTIKCYGTYWSEYEISNNPSGIIIKTINDKDSVDNNFYTSRYSALIKDNFGIDFTIQHEQEATQEELDAIVQIFMDNVVIIR